MKIKKFEDYISEATMSKYDLVKNDRVTYKGTTYIVDDVDEYIVKLYNEEEDSYIELNSNMLKTAIIKKVN